MDTIRALILSPLLGGPPYLAFASLLLGICVGFPFSSDVTLITGGVLAGTGIFELQKAILVAWCSILLGDSITFFVGRKYGHRIARSRAFRRLCSEERFEEIAGFLNQNASKFIFMVRFTPAARMIIFLTAGTVQVKPSVFFRMNALSTAIYVPAVLTLSSMAANRAEELVTQFQAYNRSILAVLLAVVLAFVYYRRRVRAAREERAAFKRFD